MAVVFRWSGGGGRDPWYTVRYVPSVPHDYAY